MRIALYLSILAAFVLVIFFALASNQDGPTWAELEKKGQAKEVPESFQKGFQFISSLDREKVKNDRAYALKSFDTLIEFGGAIKAFSPDPADVKIIWFLIDLPESKFAQIEELFKKGQSEKALSEVDRINKFYSNYFAYPNSTITMLIASSTLKRFREIVQTAPRSMKTVQNLKVLFMMETSYEQATENAVIYDVVFVEKILASAKEEDLFSGNELGKWAEHLKKIPFSLRSLLFQKDDTANEFARILSNGRVDCLKSIERCGKAPSDFPFYTYFRNPIGRYFVRGLEGGKNTADKYRKLRENFELLNTPLAN